MTQLQTFEIKDDDTVLVNGVEYKRTKEPPKATRFCDKLHFMFYTKEKEAICALVDEWLKERMPNGSFTGPYWEGYKTAILHLKNNIK